MLVLSAAFATGCGGHGRALGTIVFESGFSGREALYGVRPDGTGTTKLPLNLPADGADVAWTRDDGAGLPGRRAGAVAAPGRDS